MFVIVKIAQFIGFAVMAIIALLFVLSAIVSQLPQETTVQTSVTQITPA